MMVQKRVMCHHSAFLGKNDNGLEEFECLGGTVWLQANDRPQVNLKSWMMMWVSSPGIKSFLPYLVWRNSAKWLRAAEYL